jgi:RNA polymerase sigma factor (sigma-70 family)
MLGSLQDAEEVVQETLLRARQRRDEVRASAARRAWLYQIATNACLDQLRKAGRRRRALPHLVAAPSTTVRIGPPLEEQFWVEPAPDALLEAADEALAGPDERASRRESIVLSFIAALQLLSPKQRAALLLVDVLGWTRRKRPRCSGRACPPSTPYCNALARASRWRVTSLLRRPCPSPIRRYSVGSSAPGQFFAAIWATLPGQRRLLPLTANGGLGVAVYNRPTTPDALFQAGGITWVTFRDGKISAHHPFRRPSALPVVRPAVAAYLR